MDKLGKILVPKSKPTLETNSTLTGDGVNTPLSLNYTAWKVNTDELLWSGGPQSSIQVSKPLNLYERVMFRLGHNGYGKQFEEYSTNSSGFFLNPMFAKDSANSEVWFETNEWRYGDTKRDLVWQGHCYRRNLKAGAGTFEDLSAGVAGYEDEKYPISEVWGVNRIDFNTFIVYCDYSEGGTLTSNKSSGYNGEICTLISTPDSEEWRCSAIDITGATLTGNNFMFENSNVTASAGFEHSKNLTLENGEHGVLSADRMTGFSGDVVTVDATTDTGWYLSGLDVTGAEATGFKIMFTGSNVTALGKYTDVGFPITYESDEHVSCTGDVQIYTPGSDGIQLQTGYDAYYRISGYDVTGGYVENGVLYPTGPCTARAIAMLNAFTASGGFEHGSNVTALARYGYNEGDATIGAKYATTSYHTSNVPTAWYNTSNRWKVTTNEASGYQITLNPKMTVTGNGNNAGSRYYFTACSLIGSTQTQSQSQNRTGNGSLVYSESFTSNSTGVNYGLSGHMHVWAARGDAYIGYVAADTTGTWIATGVLP